MNKKQFFRLTIVLVIPFAILSWWLSQQDFIFERGQQISCNVEENSCGPVFSFSLKKYNEMNNNNFLKYSNHDGETIIFLTNFKYPIGPAYFSDIENNRKIIDPDANPYITANTLENMGCSISFNNYFCQDISGRFSFKDNNDAEKFKNLIQTAKKKFEKAETIRFGIASFIFLGILFSYFVISFIIKFIIYGTNR